MLQFIITQEVCFILYRDKPEKAIADFTKAKELDASHNLFNIYLNRGNAYLSIQEFDKGNHRFNRCNCNKSR